MKNNFLGLLALLAACSPLKTSPHDEKHQLELTLHEVQTNLDDLRHDINCFQTEMQILDGRIKYYESSLANLKQQDIEKTQSRIDQISHQVAALEKKMTAYEKTQTSELKDLEKLASHANETTSALVQFKNRLQEVEQDLSVLGKLKGNLESIAKSLKQEGDFKIYKVSAGDSLEKIAKQHKTTVQKIRELNRLQQDLIVVGQELKIPQE